MPSINGVGTSSCSQRTSPAEPVTPPSPSEINHVNHVSVNDQKQSKLENTAAANNGEQHTNNPRGGVIGRTPTPPSAPTPIYEKDAR